MARKGQTGVINLQAQILAEEIVYAYPQGLFPMAETREAVGYAWYRPDERGLLPLEGFHVSKSLKKFARQNSPFLEFCYDRDFEAVITACAARDETWINSTIRDAFLLLHQNGMAHSAEVYLHGELIGGVYGLALGGAFFGESMFSSKINGSKLALLAMLGDLNARGFVLYDTQFLTEHLASLGGYEMGAKLYEAELNNALEMKPLTIKRGPFDGLKYLI